MGQTGRYAQQYGEFLPLGEGEGIFGHLIGLLLCRGFECGDHGELAVETGVLLVLRRVHRGVVGGHDNHAAVDTGHGGIDEGVGGDVHPDMFHAHHAAASGVGHAQRRLHGGLLVGAPRAVYAVRAGGRGVLYVFGYLRTRGPGIGIYPLYPRMQGSLGNSFVAQQQFYLRHILSICIRLVRFRVPGLTPRCGRCRHRRAPEIRRVWPSDCRGLFRRLCCPRHRRGTRP